MKKLLFILLGFFIALISLENILALDVAYIVKNSPNPNIELILKDLNFDYEVIKDVDIPQKDFSNYAVLLIQDNVNNKNYLPLNSKNLLFIDQNYAQLVWPYPTWSPSVNVYLSSTLTSNLEQFQSPFTDGFSNLNFNAYTTAKGIYYLKVKPSDVKRIALTTGSQTPAAIVAYSNKYNLRYVFFGFYEINYWTSDTKKLFKNSLKWVRMGVDFDGDGYYSDFDCDDNNADLWQYLDGYVDKDKDGFGSGNLIKVCAGNELPIGYSDNNLDCRDNDGSVNPNGKEIPYNGIDDDCKNGDVGDVDGDGYCKTGYLILNKNLCYKEVTEIGTDCNDNDPDFNIGSNDVYKNCVNDAPFINDINKISVYESEIVRLEVIASDPEEDSLEYSVNDSRFVQDLQNKNTFTWQTNYEDSGKYKFKVKVKDYEKESEKEFEVEVLNKNRAPVCNEIPTLSWNEDEKYEVDLKNYCFDNDRDNLEFSVEDVPNGNHIFLDKIEDGIAQFSVEKDWSGEEWIIFKVKDGVDETKTNKINLKINPVNDAPLLRLNIPNIEIREDENFIDYLDLKRYFWDVDKDDLTFSVSGNENVSIIIKDGIVSFYPKKDWSGKEKIIFSVSDGYLSASSNEVILEVLDVNEPPEFKKNEIECKKDILEDTEESCELKVFDFENDSLSFNVTEENFLNCSVDGNVLKYVSYKDYYGPAFCKIKVEDSYGGYDYYMLNVQIENVNDPPVIERVIPSDGYLKILENITKRFRVIISDIDSAVLTRWFLNNEEVGNNSYYDFNKTFGDYNLTAIVSDEEFNDFFSWSIFVRDVRYFSCSEVGGFVCNENQICSQNFLNVYDSNRCCPVVCSEKPPEFKSIKKLDVNKSTNLIKTNILEPSNMALLEIGDDVSVRINLENHFGKKLIFESEIYFYDITKEKIINNKKILNTVGSGESRIFNTTIKVEEELDENDRYAIFVRTIANYNEDDGKKEYFNESYNEIRLKRKNHHVVVKDIDINQNKDDFVCGDYLDVSVNLKNFGKSNENVKIKIKNKELFINEESETINLERYGFDDDVKKVFNLKIPENLNPGWYVLRFEINYSNQSLISEKNIYVDCFKEKVNIETLGVTKINTENSKLNINPNYEFEKEILFFVLNLFVLILALLLFFCIGIYRGRNKKFKSF